MSDVFATASPLLARFPLFQIFRTDVLEALIGRGDLRHVALGERILRRGDVGDHVYLLLRGRVRFSRSQPDGTRVTLALGTTGDLIGDEALTPPGHYVASCAAADPSDLLRLAVDDLLDLICQEPAADYRLENMIRLHRLVRHLRDGKFAGFQERAEFQSLLDAVQTIRINPGTRLTIAGETGDRWYFLRSGICTRRHADVALGGLGPGECFGSESLLGISSPADIQAASSVAALCLSPRDFEQQDSAATASGLLVSQGVAFTWIGQRHALDCGAAALAMAARRLGRRVAIEDVTAHIRMNERGTPLDALCRAAAAIGLSGQAIHASPEPLATVCLPAIALLTSEHYLIVYEVNERHVLVGDPARGLLTMPRAQFLEQWSGYLLPLQRAAHAGA